MRAAWYEQQGPARDVLTVGGRVRLGSGGAFFALRSAMLQIASLACEVFITSLFLSVIGGAVVLAQDVQTPQQTLTPKESSGRRRRRWWVPSGAAGIQTVILKGDPTKAGLYTMLLRLPPNTKIQAHSHKDDRTAVVLSGVWYFGYGREFNEAALKELPAGSFLYGAARHRALRDDERPGNDNRNYGIRTIRHRVRRRKTRPGEKVDRSRPAS